jgi:hypothetical protein
VTGGDLVSVAHEGQAKQRRRRQQALDELAIVEAHPGEAGVAVGRRALVEERPGTEAIDEPPKLASGDRLPGQVDLMDRDPPLLEEPDGCPGPVIAFVAEDLDPWVGHVAIVAVVALRADPGTIRQTGGARVTVWFTVKLDDRPGALARMATALADRGVNIAGIVGIAEDTDGELMLETSNAEETRAAFDAAGIDYQAHDADGGNDPGRLSIADIVGR